MIHLFDDKKTLQNKNYITPKVKKKTKKKKNTPKLEEFENDYCTSRTE